MALTDTAIRNAKSAEKPIKMADGGGLYLLLNQNGSKWWRLDYRFGGKRKTLSMGVYPEVGLRDARERREAARKMLANGIDPGENRKAIKASKQLSAANSFEVVAREWFGEHRGKWAATHADKIIRRLEKDVFPWSPPSRLSSRPCSFCIGAGMSANGAPLRNAPGLRAIRGM